MKEMDWEQNAPGSEKPYATTLFVWLRSWGVEPRQVDLGWWDGTFWTVTKRDERCSDDAGSGARGETWLRQSSSS